MKTVIFACIHNAGRSQMAAAVIDGPSRLSKPSKATKNWAKLEPLALKVNDCPAMPVMCSTPSMWCSCPSDFSVNLYRPSPWAAT